MTVLDIILLIPPTFGFVRGLFKGLVGELASLVGLVLGIFGAYYFSEDVYHYLASFIEDPGTGLRVFSYIAVFVAVVLVVYLISKLITKFLKFLALGILNRILGALFGTAKWLLILLIAIYFIQGVQRNQPFIEPQTLQNSVVYSTLADYTHYLKKYLHEATELREKVPEVKPSSP